MPNGKPQTGYERFRSEINADFDSIRDKQQKQAGPEPVEPLKLDMLTLTNVEEKKIVPPDYAIQGIMTRPGAYELYGAMKSGKTILAMQLALDYCSGNSFLGYYKMLESRGVLFVEQDDPNAVASVQTISRAYRSVKHPDNFHLVTTPNLSLGPRLTEALERQIREKDIGLTVLDSYTTLRSSHQRGDDIVKSEAAAFGEMNLLGINTDSIIVMINHESKGSVTQSWDFKAAGTYGIALAVEGLIRISRFADLPDINAPERLIQIRGRHISDTFILVRFCREALGYDFVTDGAGAAYYPDFIRLQQHFQEQTFTPKDVRMATGAGEATVTRMINRLYYCDAIRRVGHGTYRLTDKFK